MIPEDASVNVGTIFAETAFGVAGHCADWSLVSTVLICRNTLTVLIGPDRPLRCL